MFKWFWTIFSLGASVLWGGLGVFHPMYPSVSLTSEKLSFSCIHWASNSPSHFYYFANLKFLSLQYYWLRYKCDDCQYSYFHYKQISGINTTSTNVSVSRGAQWTVMLQVYTRYGYGKYAQVTLVTTAVVNPVTDLNAKLDSSTKGLVHLTWKASPGSSDIQVRNIEHLMRWLFQGGALLRVTVNSRGRQLMHVDLNVTVFDAILTSRQRVRNYSVCRRI